MDNEIRTFGASTDVVSSEAIAGASSDQTIRIHHIRNRGSRSEVYSAIQNQFSQLIGTPRDPICDQEQNDLHFKGEPVSKRRYGAMKIVTGNGQRQLLKTLSTFRWSRFHQLKDKDPDSAQAKELKQEPLDEEIF
ncbi:unnamed protein product [Caenorhabditis nigoni]